MDITITKRKQKPLSEMPREHFHQGRGELYYLCEGRRRMFVGSTLYTLSAGDVMYIPPGCLHRVSYNDKNEAERYVLTFPDGAVQPGLFPVSEALFNARECPQAERLLEWILTEYESGKQYADEMVSALFGALMITVARLPRSVSSSAVRCTEEEQIQRAAQYIAMHPDRRITLDEAARYAGFSRTYFSRRFKEVTGFGFSDYLTAVRLDKAAELLRRGDVSVTETAYQCGFNDSNYFAAVFKKHFGVTPHRFRKRCSNTPML